MAEMNGASCTVISVLAGSTLLYTVYHCFMFDSCRCFVPSRRDLHRCTLVWMLVCSSMGLFIWATCWAYVKYQLGWMWLGAAYGARPWPSILFPKPYDSFNKPLTIILSLTYSAQASLNAEEGLYWYHLMRSVRSPHLAKPWIGSTPFYAWIGVSCLVLGIQVGLPWAFYDPQALQTQLCVELVVGGIIEFIVVGAATVVVVKFPAFLEHVKASGAGPDVTARLHFYHEANKVRTLFRYIFSFGVLITGIDGLTPGMVIALNPLASDIFTTAISLSFCIALVVSVMVYLPRTYGPAHSTAKVMVGVSGRATSIAALSPISPSSGLPRSSASRSPFRRSATQTSMMQMPMQNQGGEAGASQFALMSLLREGGQWEGEEDILRDVHGHGPHSPLTPVSGTVSGRGDIDGAEVRRRGNGPSDKGGTDAYGQRQPKGSLGSLVRETKPIDDWSDQPTLPAAIQNYTSPIAPHVEPRVAAGPVEIRIRVEQQVHHDN